MKTLVVFSIVFFFFINLRAQTVQIYMRTPTPSREDIAPSFKGAHRYTPEQNHIINEAVVMMERMGSTSNLNDLDYIVAINAYEVLRTNVAVDQDSTINRLLKICYERLGIYYLSLARKSPEQYYFFYENAKNIYLEYSKTTLLSSEDQDVFKKASADIGKEYEAFHKYLQYKYLDNYSNSSAFLSFVNECKGKTYYDLYVKPLSYELQYAYNYTSPILNNDSNPLNGITISRLRNSGIGYYFSFSFNNAFFTPKNNYTKFDNEYYSLTASGNTKTSSALFSMGVMTKIFDPFFVSAGVGIGMSIETSKYDVQNLLTDNSSNYWLYDNKTRSFVIAPEVGLFVKVPKMPITLFTHIRYVYPFTNELKERYKSFSYSMGAGFSIPSVIRPGFYIAPCVGVSQFKSIDVYGISFGLVSKPGIYASVLLPRESNSLSNINFENKEKSNFFATVGFGGKIIAPVFFYVGAGGMRQKEISEEIVKNKWKFNPEVGLNIIFSHLLLRGGISMPMNIVELDYDFSNLYWSLGIGYVWQKKK